MVIKNVLVYGEDQVFTEGEIYIKEGQFAAEASGNDETVDGEGCFAIPGLIDIHFHGCVGDDFCDASGEAIGRMAEYEASSGITSICPATMTLEEKQLHEIMSTAGDYRKQEKSGAGEEGRAKLVGINMEGPFISAKKKGAQAADHIRPCCTGSCRKNPAVSSVW